MTQKIQATFGDPQKTKIIDNILIARLDVAIANDLVKWAKLYANNRANLKVPPPRVGGTFAKVLRFST